MDSMVSGVLRRQSVNVQCIKSVIITNELESKEQKRILIIQQYHVYASIKMNDK